MDGLVRGFSVAKAVGRELGIINETGETVGEIVSVTSEEGNDEGSEGG